MLSKTLPTTAGISLKSQHYQSIIEHQPPIGWLEIHPENYMGAGGLPHFFLSRIAENYPLSMHGVGLSLGSANGINNQHLDALADVVSRYQPAQVSEHLAWSHWHDIFLNDLLPLPYTDDFLSIVISNIHKVQDKLQRTILIENPSIYLALSNNTLTETDFLRRLVAATDCGLLLDINNVYVSANNQHYDPSDYIDQYPIEHIGEIHLAGHATNTIGDEVLLIDDHGSEVCNSVWQLFEKVIDTLQKPVATLIEWDTNIPSLSQLLREAHKADNILQACNSQLLDKINDRGIKQ
jgi:uncharacterized protein (UPF0276 family)